MFGRAGDLDAEPAPDLAQKWADIKAALGPGWIQTVNEGEI